MHHQRWRNFYNRRVECIKVSADHKHVYVETEHNGHEERSALNRSPVSLNKFALGYETRKHLQVSTHLFYSLPQIEIPWPFFRDGKSLSDFFYFRSESFRLNGGEAKMLLRIIHKLIKRTNSQHACVISQFKSIE